MNRTAAQKSVFISGGGAGIGRETARQFAAAGWRVGLGDVDAEALAQTQAMIGASCETVVLDVTDPAQWQDGLATFCGAGGLDLLVNNAGVLSAGPFESIPLAAHRRLIDINVTGVINGCHCALPWLRKAPDPRLINIASASAIYGQPDIATYSASKFAVRALTEALDIEWARHGVQVSALWPIFVRTAMVDNAPEMRATQKLGVHLKPEDVASVILKTAQSRRPALHIPVGPQAGLLRTLIGVVPDRIASRLVAHFAGY
jgi:NAD(P)-dependent dehydrogenase (short-subunit alcohol dehydrogenase family)